MPRSAEELQSIMDSLTKTSVGYGQIPSINRGRYLSVGDASLSLERRDPVFIVFFPSGPKIYPQKIMVWHEVVNEVFDGVPYCITYAPITGCVAAYESRVDGLELVLDNEGRLYNNNSVLIDRNTGSLWLQIIGMAFSGPLFGKGLRHIPVWWTTWHYAREAYPKAQVLSASARDRKPYGRDPYGSYFVPGSYYSDDRILYPLAVSKMDRRLHPKTRILGFEFENLLFAVVESEIKAKKVVNFFIGPQAMVAFLDTRVDVVRVFDRQVWDRPLLFKNDNGRLVDIETGTEWSFDGKALNGNLKGASMDEYVGIYAFWFGWAAFNPESLIVPGPTVVPDSALIKGQPL